LFRSDCSRYKPEELDVKVEGNTIIITAKQEVKETGGTRYCFNFPRPGTDVMILKYFRQKI
jgi:hypothetical protein